MQQQHVDFVLSTASYIFVILKQVDYVVQFIVTSPVQVPFALLLHVIFLPSCLRSILLHFPHTIPRSFVIQVSLPLFQDANLQRTSAISLHIIFSILPESTCSFPTYWYFNRTVSITLHSRLNLSLSSWTSTSSGFSFVDLVKFWIPMTAHNSCYCRVCHFHFMSPPPSWTSLYHEPLFLHPIFIGYFIIQRSWYG